MISSFFILLHFITLVSAPEMETDGKRSVIMLNSNPFTKDTDLDKTISNYLVEQAEIDRKMNTGALTGISSATYSEKWDFSPYKKHEHHTRHKKRLRKRRRKHLWKRAEDQVEKLDSHAETDACLSDSCNYAKTKDIGKRMVPVNDNDYTDYTLNEHSFDSLSHGASSDAKAIYFTSHNDFARKRNGDKRSHNSGKRYRGDKKIRSKHPHDSGPKSENEKVVERNALTSLPAGLPPDIAAEIKKMQQKSGSVGSFPKTGPPASPSKANFPNHAGIPHGNPVGGHHSMFGGSHSKFPAGSAMPTGRLPAGPASGFPGSMPVSGPAKGPLLPPAMPPGGLSGGAPALPSDISLGSPSSQTSGLSSNMPFGGSLGGAPSGLPSGMPLGGSPGVSAHGSPGYPFGGAPDRNSPTSSFGMPSACGVAGGVAPGFPPHLPPGMITPSGNSAGNLPKPAQDYTWLKESLKVAVDNEEVKSALQKAVIKSMIPIKMLGAVKPQHAASFSVQYTTSDCSEIATFKALFPNQAASACMVCQAGGSPHAGGGEPPMGHFGAPHPMPGIHPAMPQFDGKYLGGHAGGGGPVGMPPTFPGHSKKSKNGHMPSFKNIAHGAMGKLHDKPKGMHESFSNGIPGLPAAFGRHSKPHAPSGFPSGIPGLPPGMPGSAKKSGPTPGLPGAPPAMSGMPGPAPGMFGSLPGVPGSPSAIPGAPAMPVGPAMPGGPAIPGVPPAPGIPAIPASPAMPGAPPGFPGLPTGMGMPGLSGGGPQSSAVPSFGSPMGPHGLPPGFPPSRRRRKGHRSHQRPRRSLRHLQHYIGRVYRAASGRCVPICEIRDVRAKCTMQGDERSMALTVVGVALVPPAKDFKKCSKKCELEWELLLQYAAAEKVRAYFASGSQIAAGNRPNVPVPSSWQVEKVLRCPSSDLTLETGLCYPQGNWVLRALLAAQESETIVSGIGGGAVLLLVVVFVLLVYFKVIKCPKFCKNICKGGFKLGGGPKKAGESETLGEGGAGTVEFSEDPPPPPPP